jgi:hypothetical protein
MYLVCCRCEHRTVNLLDASVRYGVLASKKIQPKKLPQQKKVEEENHLNTSSPFNAWTLGQALNKWFIKRGFHRDHSGVLNMHSDQQWELCEHHAWITYLALYDAANYSDTP